ncbi:hypothetical protein LTR12_002774 [Friedmanniomyces endolithicus]|nr:hypothetical protein LTR12_002774 [Friedmanniomyces endolithicus]
MSTSTSTPWTEQQHPEHYTIAPPPITNQPGGIRASSARSTSHFDFNMQMLASAAQMRGVNSAGPTLPDQFDSRAGTNRVVDLLEPISPHINANATDATDSALSASTSASTSGTGAMTSAGLNSMKTTESVTAAHSTNVIDGVNRRFATRELGAHGLPPPTPHSTGSERSATMPDQAEGDAPTAQGPAQINPQKGHNNFTPKHLLSQKPTAIALRAWRAAERLKAGKKQKTLLSQPASTSAIPINPSIRHPASSRFTHALSKPASPFPAVTPAKRTATDDTESTTAKRRCIMLSQASFDDASETVATPKTVPALIDRGSALQNQQHTYSKPTTPGVPGVDAEGPATPPLSTKVVLHPTTGRPVPAQSLADIVKYSQATEDLDWTNCKDPKKRLRMQTIIQDRKRQDRKVAKMRRKKSRTSELEALINTREIRKSTEPGSFGLRERIVYEGDDHHSDEAAGETGDPIERNRASAEPARAASSGRYTAQSLAGIAKDSREGGDPDRTKIIHPVECKAVRHTVSDRKRPDPDAVRSRPMNDRDALAIARKGTVARSVAIASTVPDACADDDTESELDQLSDAEDDNHNSTQDDQALAKPVSRSIVTARPLSAQSSADIIKYSLAGEDLDWSKCHNISERKRMRNLIHRRKCDDRKANKTRTAKRMTPANGTLKAVEPTGDADTVQGAHEESGDEDAEDEGIEDEEADVAVAEHEEAGVAVVEDEEADVEEADVAAPEEEEANVEEVMKDSGRVSDTAYDTPEPESLRSDDVQTIDFVGGTFSEQEYVQDLIAFLDRIGKSNSNAFYARQCRRIGALLTLASSPKSGEMLIKTTSEQAAKVVETNAYFPGPLVTYGQQPMPLQTQHQFFGEYYDETVQVHVQDPSARVAKYEPRVRIVNIATVKARFSQPVTGTPWNVLELAAHCDDGIRPAFLNREDCTLLTKLKLPCTGETASRLGFTEGFQEVEKWVLAAQAGALTEPHQDSHGYSTYITVNQGYVGFGWLSNPTDDERAAWSNAHDTYTGGRWRYVILRPGTTVYFPAGTIHFVFRHPAAGNTLAFGGHVLRCSQIVRWIKVLRAEQSNGNITNEDLSVSAPRYLDRVEKFVKQAQKSGREEMWGGKGAIEEFLTLKQVFDAQAARNEKKLKKAGRRA